MIDAKVICDSVSEAGTRITTFQVRAPKFIDAELRTHRMLSQNSSSDRAIPFNKMVEKDCYIPMDIRKNQKGMQGYEKVSDNDATGFRYDADEIYDFIIKKLIPWNGKIHKQHINRYLLPFAMQDKVITATELDNFFNLRLAADAQPEIQEVARKMKEAMDKSTPKILEPGEWHLPYVEFDVIGREYFDDTISQRFLCLDEAIKCSAARCARVSYGNHDGSDPDVEKDLKLYHFLVSSGHLSPLEHQATPMERYEQEIINDIEPHTWQPGVSHVDGNYSLWSGTLREWIQYRKLVDI